MNTKAVEFLLRFLKCPPDKPLPRPESDLDHMTVSVVMMAAAGNRLAYKLIRLVLRLYHRARKKEVHNGEW
jgi:hypothetical protein